MDNLEYLINEFSNHRKESNEKLEKILVQTTRTNGRVDAIKEFQEEAEKDLQELKTMTKIAKVMGGILLTLVSALFGWYLSKH